MPPQPSCVAAVLCDQALQDVQTRKWVLVGTWNRLFAQKVPAAHPSLSIYFALSDAVGTYRTRHPARLPVCLGRSLRCAQSSPSSWSRSRWSSS